MVSPALILYFAAALTVSFICSLFEATLLSTSPSHIEMLCQKGRRAGMILRQLKTRVDHPLIAILTLNTVANMFGAAGVGAEAGRLARVNELNGAVFVGVVSGLLTLCILVLSEIVPKTLGAVYWKPLAPLIAMPLRVLVLALLPVVIALEAVPRIISRSAKPAYVSRDELGTIAQMAHAQGTLGRTETRIVGNLLRLRDARASTAMTPRLEVFALERKTTVKEALDQPGRIRYSRIPVYDMTIDKVIGIVLRSKLNETAIKGDAQTPVGDLTTPIHAVPETAPLLSLLEVFIERREHLFLVVNEHGGIEGIISLEDVIESLLGEEIVDELDLVADLRKLAERKGEARKRRLRAND